MNKVRFTIKIIFIFLIILFLQACTTIQIFRAMNNKQAVYTDYSDGNKIYRFVKMVHIGQSEFYKNVATLIENAKKDSFVLFYEYIDFKEANDIEKRKIKRIMGFIANEDTYKKMAADLSNSEHTYTNQENTLFLNKVNHLDFRTDITPTELVRAYEAKFGTIVLSKTEMEENIDSATKPTSPSKNALSIIINYRNKHLASEINKSPYHKIIIVYGFKHEKGLYEEMKKINPAWKKLNQ